ncbi:hypothetical protein TNCV_2097961 [Trichonephila clavipes]|nr:hypothetical protein TNCV_2097961 [Trichonephila clavipes]
MFEKVYVLFDFSTVSSEEFVAVEGVNVCRASVMANKEILEFVKSSKNIIDANSNAENEMNNTAPVPTSFEMKNMKSILSFFTRTLQW